MNEYNRIEARFSANYYHGYTENNKGFLYRKGSIPIIISVPHSVTHMNDNTIKHAEAFTGTVGLILHELTGAHLIAKCAKDQDNPNNSAESPYVDALCEIVNKNDIKLVLDIHGADSTHDFCIDVGTNNGSIIDAKTIELFKDAFLLWTLMPVNITVNKVFGATGDKEVVNRVNSTTGADAMQLEISKLYRDPKNNPDKIKELIHCMHKFIEHYNLYHLQSSLKLTT